MIKGQTTRANEMPVYTLRAWVVVLSAALFFFYEFIQMNMFNAIDPSLMVTFKVDAAALGNLSATYFYGNLVFLIPAGILLDRYSTRRLLLTAITICVLCTYFFALSTQLWEACLFRFLTGIASTFCMLSTVRLASRWFPPHKIALVIGMVVTMAMAGGMLAQTPLALMAHSFGWRHAVMINASLGVVFILVIALVVYDYPPQIKAAELSGRAAVKIMGFRQSFLLALRNPQNWVAGIFTNLLSFPVIILGAAWGSLYLMHVHHLTHIQTTNITQMIFLGMIFGSPLMGWISDRLGLRKLPMIIGAALTFLVMLVIVFDASLGYYGLIFLFFLLGLLSGVQVISYPLVVESNSRHITTTAEGITCLLIMSAGLFQVVFGWLIQFNSTQIVQSGVSIYSAQDYQRAILLLPAGFLLAFVLAFFIKETYCKNRVSP